MRVSPKGFQSLLCMIVKPIRDDLIAYVRKRGLKNKFDKQLKLFLENPLYPSLNTELLEPKSLHIYSFRIDRQYRAIFIIVENEVEIVDINNHYK